MVAGDACLSDKLSAASLEWQLAGQWEHPAAQLRLEPTNGERQNTGLNAG